MTKKEYVKVAEILRQHRGYAQGPLELLDDGSGFLVEEFCRFFRADNPNFNEATFRKAVEK